MIRGGAEIGAATLIDFYTLHTTLVPVLWSACMALHFWRVRKAGGVVDPAHAGERQATRTRRTVLFLPHLLVREARSGPGR